MIMESATIKAQLKKRLKLSGKSTIIVVGLGATGDSVVRYLTGLGFKFSVADSRQQLPPVNLAKPYLKNCEIVCGPFDSSRFMAASHLIVSPGVSLSEPAIAAAQANGVRVIGDIDLFACSVDVPIIAITGSNGKSTVTTLVGEMAAACKIKAGVGGNLGVPALDLLATNADLYVLELSSFQLERTHCLNATAATVLNVTPDHLDRHANLIDYATQKQRVFVGKGALVINLDDPLVSIMREKGRRNYTFSIIKPADFCIGGFGDNESLFYGGQPILPVAEIPLEGRHNIANVLAALALGTAVGMDEANMCRAIRRFVGLPHRMQKVAEIAGITWVNDSKATNIGACVAALEGYLHKVILIAGGDAKGADMADLVAVVKEKAKSVVLMGKDAGLIKTALNGCVPVYEVNNMSEAVATAAKLAEAGDSVLLSPACASLDQYKNYQERGDKFAEAVLRLAA